MTITMRPRLAALLLLLLPLAGAGRASPIDRLFIPATRPSAPVETLTASDLPLLPAAGGDETLAGYLKTFEPPPGKFEYTLQLISEEEDFRLYRLVFPSPVKTPWPENNVVPAEFTCPARPARPRKSRPPSCSTSSTAARSCPA